MNRVVHLDSVCLVALEDILSLEWVVGVVDNGSQVDIAYLKDI